MRFSVLKGDYTVARKLCAAIERSNLAANELFF
jgi:hypothetical protein